MSKDNNIKVKQKVVDSIHYEDKRASIPDSTHQGEEEGVVANQPKESEYNMFRHEFQRGRDPELYWLNKYKNDDEETEDPRLKIDIRSLYKHEDVRPEAIIDNLYDLHEQKDESAKLQLDLFGDNDFEDEDELERLAGYYTHNDNWKNRLIQGDSLLVMNSLLNREGMAGQVQCVYMDPPYGINYKSNWQIKLNSREIKDTDKNLSGEPEMIKAYRDTWELGIHSYLSYLRDRLIVVRELLSDSGSCFVQISDENVHLVRAVMDEVFGSENFVSMIIYTKTSGFTSNTIGNVADFIVWYAKNINLVKVRKLYVDLDYDDYKSDYSKIELDNGQRMTIKEWEKIYGKEFSYSLRPKGSRVYRTGDLTSQGSANVEQPFEYNGKIYNAANGRHWTANFPNGMERLKKLKRIQIAENSLAYVRYFDDFLYKEINNIWSDTGTNQMGGGKLYVCQSSVKSIQRCILMTSDPGDLVLDPTCGSGTTAYASELWGRRWITIDTSRIALNIAKKRLLTALFPYYVTFDESENPNIKQGFKYKKVPHITLKALANNLPFDEEILYDQPEEDKKRIRVSGPFTVETLQSLDVSSPETLNDKNEDYDEYALFTERIFANLKSNGIRNGAKEQQAIMYSMEHLDEPYLNAKGYFKSDDGKDNCVYFMIGPKFGTVSKKAVNEAVKAFRHHLDESSWLAILGFSFEDNIESGENKDYNFGTFQVSKVRMSDDLLQEGLLKKDKKAGSFIIIGEPDVSLVKDDAEHYHVEINGMDMYDPIKDEVKARNVNDIAYWEMDDNYTESLFKVRSIHFCGGDRKEFSNWRKGLSSVAKQLAKKRAEHTLKLEFNDELWDNLYGFKSESISYEKGKKIAVRVVSQFGEEATKVLTME